MKCMFLLCRISPPPALPQKALGDVTEGQAAVLFTLLFLLPSIGSTFPESFTPPIFSKSLHILPTFSPTAAFTALAQDSFPPVERKNIFFNAWGLFAYLKLCQGDKKIYINMSHSFHTCRLQALKVYPLQFCEMCILPMEGNTTCTPFLYNSGTRYIYDFVCLVDLKVSRESCRRNKACFLQKTNVCLLHWSAGWKTWDNQGPLE